MSNTNNQRFDFFSSRLHFIKVTSDDLLNLELWRHLDAFESHVYGVFLQYNRIKLAQEMPDPVIIRKFNTHQLNLDIYFYTLVWDKLKKIYSKIAEVVNRIQQNYRSTPSARDLKAFTDDFRLWKTRIDKLFSEFDGTTRNEYEHPSLKPHLFKNIQFWKNISSDSGGNIKAHVGNKIYALIKYEHFLKIDELRTALFDLFTRHFSQKSAISDLIKIRDYIENNIDHLSSELKTRIDNNDENGFHDILNQFMSYYLVPIL